MVHPPPCYPSDAPCVVLSFTLRFAPALGLSFTLHFALAEGLVDLTSLRCWGSQGDGSHCGRGRKGVPDTPYGGGPAEGRLDTSSVCSSHSDTSEKVQAASQRRGGPRLAVLVLAPMRCLKPVPRALQQDGLPFASAFPLLFRLLVPYTPALWGFYCQLPGAQATGCIPCWRTSHPAADLEQSRKLKLPGVGRPGPSALSLLPFILRAHGICIFSKK